MVSSMRESIVTSSTCPRKQGIGRKRKRQDINNAGQSLRVLDILDIPVVHIWTPTQKACSLGPIVAALGVCTFSLAPNDLVLPFLLYLVFTSRPTPYRKQVSHSWNTLFLLFLQPKLWSSSVIKRFLFGCCIAIFWVPISVCVHKKNQKFIKILSEKKRQFAKTGTFGVIFLPF